MNNIHEFSDAIILYANYARFTPGKVIRYEKVQSRMLLWCKSGKGTVTVNGEKFLLSAGSFLVIPWNHKIFYKADTRNPFLLDGIHIVPELKRRGNPTYRIFLDDNELEEYNERKDIHLSGFNSVFHGNLRAYNSLEMLCEYIITWFQKPHKEESQARILAQALIGELISIKKQPEYSLPHTLNRMLIHINDNIEKRIEVSELAEIGDCSKSTVFRLFRENLECTPVIWILRKKVAYASELLKKTNLRIGETGAKISIDDPYYFSKIFKKYKGMTASEFRKSHSLV